MIKKIKNIQKLLNPWIKNIPQKKICNISLYRKKIQINDLIIILKKKKEHKKKILTAIKKKAGVVLYETKKNKHGLCISTKYHTLIIFFKKLNKYIHKIYERFFNYPQKKIKLIGVIGTYGKTTVTQLIIQWKKIINKKVVIEEILEDDLYNPVYSMYFNTNTNNSIQKKLYSLVKKKIKIAILKMPFNILIQNQISYLIFESIIFTNLTNNNLDGQKNMFQKEKIKFSFLNNQNIKNIILNGDENITNNWIKKFKKKNTISVTMRKNNNIFHTKNWINIIKIIYKTSQTKIFFNSTWGSGNIYSSLIGDFNITNILLAMATMLSFKYSLELLIQSSALIKPIKRRIEKIKKKNSPLFLINNVSSPQILYRIFNSFNYYNYNSIWCILGYEKIRNISERKIIGNIVEKFSDFIIFVNNDFKNEKNKNIIKDIISGSNKKNKFFIFCNEKKAIQFIFSQTNKYDIILILEQEKIVKIIINYLKKNF